LTATLAEQDETIAALQAAQPEQADESELEAARAELEAQVAELNEVILDQNWTMENLRLGLGETPVLAEDLAQLCLTRANAILEDSQITFGTGGTTINNSSVASLERLRDLAIGCQNEDLVIEIGGHTDSQGSETNNLTLSQSRAEAVLTYMEDLGIPTENMTATGYGEADPIATNDTNAGRAANRRITFEWQVRGAEEAEASEETQPDTTEASENDALDAAATETTANE